MIGRTHELESISGCLDAGGVLCLVGDAGIGKTTVWRAGVEWAREQDFRVLAAEPAEAERSLSYAMLADLLEPLADEVLPSLPEPQQRALERVLLLAEGEGALDARLVGAAVRTALEAIDGPLLIAVDDIQWADAASTAALTFALRRSPAPRALLALRAGHELPLRVETELLAVGPLSVGALHHLLVERLGIALQRTPLLRLHEISGGNPFYALELARANPDGRDTVLPTSLEHLVADRLRALPRETQHSLAAIALGETGGDLAPAIADGVVEEAGGAYRFSHPLFAEAAIALVTDEERRALHAGMAEKTTDPEQRARHLASAASGPDPDVAAALDNAARDAARRGAFAAAAELWELAAALTPPDHVERPNRAVEAGIAHVIAGNPDAGGELLEPNLELLPSGPLRQRGLVHLALRSARDDPHGLATTLEQVLAEAEEPQLRYEVTLLLAGTLDRLDQPERADELAEQHLRFAEQQSDPAILEDALLLAAARRMEAERAAWDLLTRAREIANARDGAGPRRAWGRAPTTLANLREGRIEEARAALEAAQSEAIRVGSASYDYGLLWNRSIVELAAGNARVSRELADEALAIAEQMDDPSLVSFALMLATFPTVVLGEVEVARSHAERALELAQRMGGGPPTTNGVFVALALLELSLGHRDVAADLYGRLTFGLRHSNVAGGRGLLDVIETFAEVGDVARAAELATRLPEDAHEKPLAEACIAAARGKLDRAIELVESVDPAPAPFRRAREQLLLGRLLRRARRKRDARVALEAARDGFVAIEAPLWAERATEELGRLGGRSPAGRTLTDAELRVAELVASGLSNKEVAARLVVTVRTVEWHLSKVYEKLGVSSRTALAARWPEEERAKTGGIRSTT